jgi:hypothetical protein
MCLLIRKMNITLTLMSDYILPDHYLEVFCCPFPWWQGYRGLLASSPRLTQYMWWSDEKNDGTLGQLKSEDEKGVERFLCRPTKYDLLSSSFSSLVSFPQWKPILFVQCYVLFLTSS